MDLLAIIRNNVEFCRNSNISVTADAAYGTVLITDGTNEIFLQGDEGYDFIDKVHALWSDAQVIGMDEAELFYAYDYLDLLGG